MTQHLYCLSPSRYVNHRLNWSSCCDTAFILPLPASYSNRRLNWSSCCDTFFILPRHFRYANRRLNWSPCCDTTFILHRPLQFCESSSWIDLLAVTQHLYCLCPPVMWIFVSIDLLAVTQHLYCIGPLVMWIVVLNWSSCCDIIYIAEAFQLCES